MVFAFASHVNRKSLFKGVCPCPVAKGSAPKYSCPCAAPIAAGKVQPRKAAFNFIMMHDTRKHAAIIHCIYTCMPIAEIYDQQPEEHLRYRWMRVPWNKLVPSIPQFTCDMWYAVPKRTSLQFNFRQCLAQAQLADDTSMMPKPRRHVSTG